MQDNDEEYFSANEASDDETQIQHKNIFIDQETQVSEIDLQTIELRTQQPFRHKYNIGTLRTDFNGDLHDKIGRGPIPAPMNFVQSRMFAYFPYSRKSSQ